MKRSHWIEFADFAKLARNGFEKVKGLCKGSEEVWFYCKTGEIVRMYHSQDCCEDVSIESIDNTDDIYTDTTFCEIQEATNSGDNEYGTFTWTFYLIRTNKGYSTIRWLGESNGYYSESVDFELYEEDTDA